MSDSNTTGFMALVESFGGADMFIWVVMFSILLIGAGFLVFFNKEQL